MDWLQQQQMMPFDKVLTQANNNSYRKQRNLRTLTF
jgi:hypothetical protein